MNKHTYSVGCNNEAALFASKDGFETVEDAMAYIESFTGSKFSCHIIEMDGDDLIYDVHFCYIPRAERWMIDGPWNNWRYISRKDIPGLFK